MPESTQTGTLTIATTTARGTIPVAGARVTVTPGDQTSQPQSDMTNADGRTKAFILAAPPLLASQTPEQPHPYAVYTVYIEADGFRPIDAIGVAVFAGVAATLPVELIPSPGSGELETEEFPPQELDRR